MKPNNLLFLLLITIAFGHPAMSQETSSAKNTVVVMGMIHGGHRTSEKYDLNKIKDVIRKIKPDYVFCEIPPDRIKKANEQYKDSGVITESRVKVFPEYVDALYPLTKELEFEIVPCAGWTKPMADARRKKLGELKTSQQENYEEMVTAQAKAEKTIENEGGDDDPAFIHTDRYDEIVKMGMEPYDRHFNEILGPGGWTNINIAHYGLIEKNLDIRKNQGKTVLIMFGAWHKYWFKEKLRLRDDITIVNVNEYLK